MLLAMFWRHIFLRNIDDVDDFKLSLHLAGKVAGKTKRIFGVLERTGRAEDLLDQTRLVGVNKSARPKHQAGAADGAQQVLCRRAQVTPVVGSVSISPKQK